MAEGIELNPSRLAVETFGNVPDLAAERERAMVDAMTPGERVEYEFVQSVCSREAYLFSQSLKHVLRVMPPPADYREHNLGSDPRYDQGTVLVALKVYDNVRGEYLKALADEERKKRSRAGNGKR
jgi:hypothetical protein